MLSGERVMASRSWLTWRSRCVTALPSLPMSTGPSATVAWSGDGDPYRDLSHPGGIFIRGYREMWVRDLVKRSQCEAEPAMVDVVERMASHPFDEPEHYGPGGDVLCGPDYSQVDVPF